MSIMNRGSLSLFWCLLQFLSKQDGFITALPSRLKHLGRKILRAGGSGQFQGNQALAEAGEVTRQSWRAQVQGQQPPLTPTAWRGKKGDGQGHKVPLLAKNLFATDNSWEREKTVFFNINVTKPQPQRQSVTGYQLHPRARSLWPTPSALHGAFIPIFCCF